MLGTYGSQPVAGQIADVLDSGKLKLIVPLRKGNARGLSDREFITVEEAGDAFAADLAAHPRAAPRRQIPAWQQSLARGAAGIALLHIERAREGLVGWDHVGLSVRTQGILAAAATEAVFEAGTASCPRPRGG